MAWVTVEQVAEALGPSADVTDPFLASCTDAANEFAFQRRAAAGYLDVEDVSPGPRVEQGVVQYAVALFRERGSVDSFASFDEFSVGAVPSSSFGQVNRLLGIPKPAVDHVTEDLIVAAINRRARAIAYRGVR